jgi:hypothetical protein
VGFFETPTTNQKAIRRGYRVECGSGACGAAALDSASLLAGPQATPSKGFSIDDCRLGADEAFQSAIGNRKSAILESSAAALQAFAMVANYEFL